MKDTIENAIKELNKHPTKENLTILLEILKEFSDAYEKEFGHFPTIHIDQFLTGLSGEVIALYKDELPFSQK